MKNATLRSLDLERHTKTRIMATVGPSSMEYEVLRRMVQAGVTFFRFNGAHIEKNPEKGHLSYEEAEVVARHIRRLRSEFRQLIGIYFDLAGPKIRVQRLMGIQRKNSAGKPKSAWLQPTEGETVIIHAHNRRKEKELQAQLHAFESRSNAKAEWDKDKSIWEQREWAHKFFQRIGRTNANELMLGNEVKSFEDFDTDQPINLKDGWCKLRIIEKTNKALICTVVYVDSKFEFRPEQGANPQRHIFPKIITSKDKRDIEAALRIGADVISLSFVCSPSDADDLRKEILQAKRKILKDKQFMEGRSVLYRRYISEEYAVPIFAKIETAFAVLANEGRRYAAAKSLTVPRKTSWKPLREIANKFDGLMVARGDLAVEVEKYRVPELQRQIIELAHLKNRPVIVATEMLESMKRGDASTRAEISDINTAVHQEADILMLSGETSSTKGKPEEAVTEMRKAIEQAEAERIIFDDEKSLEELQKKREAELLGRFTKPKLDRSLRLAQGNQICVSARALASEVIITSVRTGQSTQEIAYYCPRQKILAITDDLLTAVRLVQHRGIYPVVMERALRRTLDEFIDITNDINHHPGIPHAKDSQNNFRVPGLIRIQPEFPNGRDIGSRIPNSIHVFTLPVTRQAVPEVERKYILSAENHSQLQKELQNDAEKWQLLEQTNLFFTDERRALFNGKVSIRVRVERVIAQHPAKMPLSDKIFFTLKGPETRTETVHAAERPEKEFDVTAELIGKIQGLLNGNPSLNFEAIPAFYRDYISNMFAKELKEKYNAAHQVKYEQITYFKNYRHSFEMWNGFMLELDETHFGDRDEAVEYELEVELRKDNRVSKLLDEFIKDKFGRLSIPISSPEKYPSKVVRAYRYGGLL